MVAKSLNTREVPTELGDLFIELRKKSNWRQTIPFEASETEISWANIFQFTDNTDVTLQLTN